MHTAWPKAKYKGADLRRRGAGMPVGDVRVKPKEAAGRSHSKSPTGNPGGNVGIAGSPPLIGGPLGRCNRALQLRRSRIATAICDLTCVVISRCGIDLLEKLYRPRRGTAA